MFTLSILGHILFILLLWYIVFNLLNKKEKKNINHNLNGSIASEETESIVVRH